MFMFPAERRPIRCGGIPRHPLPPDTFHHYLRTARQGGAIYHSVQDRGPPTPALHEGVRDRDRSHQRETLGQCNTRLPGSACHTGPGLQWPRPRPHNHSICVSHQRGLGGLGLPLGHNLAVDMHCMSNPSCSGSSMSLPIVKSNWQWLDVPM